MTLKSFAKSRNLTQEDVVKELQRFEPDTTIWQVKNMYRWPKGPRQALKYCAAVERWSEGKVTIAELGYPNLMLRDTVEKMLVPIVRYTVKKSTPERDA